MPASFDKADVTRIRRYLNSVVRDLEKLNETSDSHMRKIRDLIKDTEDIRSRFDRLMDLLGFEDE